MSSTAFVDPFKKRRICVLGSRSVGKSSLVVQFIENHFLESYFPTIEATFTKPIKHNAVEYTCEIIDTAGQDEFSILNHRHAVGIHGYILVYSVASYKSFEIVKSVHDKLAVYSGSGKIAVVFVGQKCDLENQRQVSQEEGRKLAEEYGGTWIETSARQNLNVDKVFDLCLAEIEKFHNPPPATPQGGRCIIM